jgi:hypothetical protein
MEAPAGPEPRLAFRLGRSAGTSSSCFSSAFARIAFFATAFTAVNDVAASSLGFSLSERLSPVTHVSTPENVSQRPTC